MRELVVRLRRATAIDVGAIVRSRPLAPKHRRRFVSTLQRDADDGQYRWHTERKSMPSRLPQHQHRGIILPMLSSTIKSADLNDVCTVAIDPGVRSELTASFVKFSSFDGDNTLNVSSFCKCFKHFGKATQSGDPSDSRRVLSALRASATSSSAAPTSTNLS